MYGSIVTLLTYWDSNEYANINYSFLDFVSKLTDIKIKKDSDIFVLSSVVYALTRKIFKIELSPDYDSEMEEVFEENLKKIKEYLIIRNSLSIIKYIFKAYSIYTTSYGIYGLFNAAWDWLK